MVMIRNLFLLILALFLLVLRKLSRKQGNILDSSPKFGETRSFIFNDWVNQTGWTKKLDKRYSERVKKRFNPELLLAGYFPVPDNKIVIYEVAYSYEEQYQMIWSFLCKKTDITDAQAKALSEVEQTSETADLKNKWGKIWEGISTKELSEVESEFYGMFDGEKGSTGGPELIAHPVSKSPNGIVTMLVHIILDRAAWRTG